MKILVAAVAMTAGVIFAAAERGPIPLLTLPAAVVALLVVETGPRKGLPAWLAGVAGIAAVVLSGREFFSDDIEGRLLSGGHLLTYLTAIVLLQGHKRLGDLYRIVTLSGLQVALSSVLTNEFWLAISLLVFLATVIWALSVLLWERLAGNSQTGSGGTARPSVRLAGPSLLFAVAAFAGGGVLFTLLPRIWMGSYQMFNNDPPPGAGTVGFTDSVSLGDIGQILESDDPVLRVKSREVVTGEPVSLSDWFAAMGSEPLFRGAVLNDYDGGGWTGLTADNSLGTTLDPQINPQIDPDMLRHDVYLHPIGTRRLFTVGPAAILGTRADEYPLQISVFDMTLMRPPEEPTSEPVRYTLWSQGVEAGGVSPLIYQTRRNTALQISRRADQLLDIRPQLRRELVEYLRAMPELAPMYDAVATRMAASGTDADGVAKLLATRQLATLTQRYAPNFTTTQIGEAIARHFDDPAFTYTLDATVVDGSIDPVLDFLRNRKSGHCEYYASACALLLKAAGIPARMVSGFKGGQEPEAGVFEVSQLHAHAWCEGFHPTSDGSAYWTTYDPTPATRAAAVEQQRIEAETRRRNPLVFLKSLWSEGVFMTKTQQQAYIYDPITERLAENWQSIQDFPSAVQALLSREAGPLSESQRRSLTNVGRMFAGLAVLVGGVLLIRYLRRRNRDRRRNRESATEPADLPPPTPWYDRFLQVAAERIGRRRARVATHREYAGEVVSQTEELAAIAGPATEEYYRVRFGRKPADPARLDRLAKELDRVEGAATSR